MPRMANDSDVAQARILLSALNDHIARISGLLEKAERQRSRPNVSRSSTEASLRRDLYEANGHVYRIHQRFPDTAPRPE
jgi:hypothetical protein